MLPTNDGGPYWSQIDEVHGRYDCLYTAACRSPGWSAFKGLPFRKQTMMCLPITNTSSPHIAWPRMTLHQRSSLHDTSHLVPSCPLSSITCVHRHGAKGSQGVQKRCKCITSTGHWLILRRWYKSFWLFCPSRYEKVTVKKSISRSPFYLLLKGFKTEIPSDQSEEPQVPK